MSDWLRVLLGLEEGEIPAGSETRWELSGMPQGAWLLLAACIVIASLVLIVALYRRERGLRLPQRALLSGLRLGALALVVLILLNPRVLTEIHLEHPGRTLLLVDTSASMGQRDELEAEEADMVEAATGLDVRLEPPTRTQIVWSALERSELVDQLGRKNRVQAFAFDSETRELGELESVDDLDPQGGETRVGEGIAAAIATVQRDPLAGVVIVSDGRNNAGESPLDVVRALALDRRVPVHAVGVGKTRVPPNLAVRDVVAPQVVEVGFPVQIEAKILLAGIPGATKVTLWRSDEAGRDRVRIDERVLEATSGVIETSLRFVDTIDRKGRYKYLVGVPRREGEIEWRDNRRSTVVTAAEEHRRVLLIAGTSTNEYRNVRNFCLRDDGIVVSCWLSIADRTLRQDGDIAIDELPRTAESLDEYDTIVLIDPDPKDLDADVQKALVSFVTDQGGGLAFVAGEVFTPEIARSPAFGTLRSLMPVDLASADALPSDAVWATPWQGAPTPNGREHPLCRLVDDPTENQRLWSALPPFYFVYPASRLRPAAIALLRSPEHVFVALHRVGLGEVIYVGSDDLWRWRSSGKPYHERYWSGLVRYLSLGKYRGGAGKAIVEVDRDRYRLGDRVRVTAQLVDGRRQPIEKPSVDALVELERREAADGGGVVAEDDTSSSVVDSRPWTLVPVPGEPGRYSATITVDEPGDYRVRIEPEGERFFRVDAPSSELEDPSPDFELLQRIADESGGRFVRLDGLDQLPAHIPETKIREVLGRRATAVWDSFAMVALFCGLLVAEWSLRKWWRLT